MYVWRGAAFEYQRPATTEHVEPKGSGHSMPSFALAAMLEEIDKGGPPLIADTPPLQKDTIIKAQEFSYDNKIASVIQADH